MEHTDIPAGEIHAPHNWEFADATARTTVVITDAALVNRWALQTDNGTYWRLSAVSPVVWVQVAEKGEQGVQGTQGIQGVQGAPGADGSDGAPGVDGAPGADGSDATVTAENVQAALGYTPESTDNKGAANGYAPLGADNKVPATYLPASGAFAPGHIYGLTLSNNAADPTNDIDVSSGSARDDANEADIVLSASLTKRLDAAWAAGSGNGGLDTGAIADGTYHVFMIKRSDTGVEDALFSTSPSAPTMPANYTHKRRIGSILREAGAIVLFSQYGDVFKRQTQVVIRSSTAPIADTLLPMKVPTGIKTAPLFIADCQLSSSGQLIQLMSDGDRATAEASVNRVAGTEYSVNIITGHFITNTAGQLRFSLDNPAGTAVTARLQANGWIDGRGQ